MRKIELTESQQKLYNELKRLTKQVNQRILRLERLTKAKEPFEVKQLYDYLKSRNLEAISEKGRVRVKKSYTEIQMKSIIKAEKRFIEGISTAKKVKKYIKGITEDSKIGYKEASTFYHAEKNYTWIYQYLSESEFWDFARDIVKNNNDYKTFEKKIMVYVIDRSIDESLKQDLLHLYNFIQGVK